MIKEPSITIGSRKIGRNFPCFVVAEISANHHQNLQEAIKLIRRAAKCGADAVKLQTYTPDTITINSKSKLFRIRGKYIPKSWKGKTLYDLYKLAYTPWEWHPKLKRLAESLGLIFFATPFDETAVDFLESINVPCYKIASYEALDVPLLRRVAATNKPVIISQAFFNQDDVEFSLNTLKKSGAREIAALHCVSQYSAQPKLEESNLIMIRELRDRFGVVSGFSDNNSGIDIPFVAAITGASIIEKHFILERKSGGLDARFSVEPEELKELINKIRRAEAAYGRVHYGVLGKQAQEIQKSVPSIFAVKNIRKNEVFSYKNIQTKRPAGGLSPKFWDEVIGKKAKVNIEYGTPLSWDLITK